MDLSLSVGGLLLWVNSQRHSRSQMTSLLGRRSFSTLPAVYGVQSSTMFGGWGDGDGADIKEHAVRYAHLRIPVSVIPTSVANPRVPPRWTRGPVGSPLSHRPYRPQAPLIKCIQQDMSTYILTPTCDDRVEKTRHWELHHSMYQCCRGFACNSSAYCPWKPSVDAPKI